MLIWTALASAGFKVPFGASDRDKTKVLAVRSPTHNGGASVIARRDAYAVPVSFNSGRLSRSRLDGLSILFVHL